MPWAHCGVSVPDSDPCPSCGTSKSEWTIHLDKTREFSFKRPQRKTRKRDAWIEVQLLNAAGDPVPDAPFRIALPSSRVQKGTTNPDGVARVEEIRAGTCQVSFPGNVEEGAERETGARHVFRLGQVLCARLEFVDPDGTVHLFPQGVSAVVEFASGATQELELGEGGILSASSEGSEGSCTFRLRPGATLQYVATGPDGATKLVDEGSQALDAALEEGHRLWSLPGSEWGPASSLWTVGHERWDGEQQQFDLSGGAVGSEAQPVPLTLDPRWMYVRFEYYDRARKERLPVLPLLLEAAPDGGEPQIKSNWISSTGTQAIPWVEVQDPPKPDGEVLLRFETDPHSWIHTAEDGTRTRVSGSEQAEPGPDRLRYYDLPEVWKSTQYFARLEGGSPEEGRLAELAGQATSDSAPIVLSLDDIVLTDKAGAPLGLGAEDRVALFCHSFTEGGDLGTSGIYKPDTANRQDYFSDVVIRGDAHNHLTDYPDWTRLVLAQGNLFDVFDRRTPDGDGVVGARAAVRWIDATAAPWGVAPDALLWPRPERFPDPADPETRFFSIQPFFQQEYSPIVNRFPGRHEEWATPYQWPDAVWDGLSSLGDESRSCTGRFDLALLRCCDLDTAGKEIAIVLNYFRFAFDFNSPEAGRGDVLGISGEVAEEFARDMCVGICARWNCSDNSGQTSVAIEPADAALALSVRPVWLAQNLPKSQAHFNMRVFKDTRAMMESAKGDGALGAEDNPGPWAGHSAVPSDVSSRSDVKQTFPTSGYVAAHEGGHGGSLPDEYIEGGTLYSMDLPPFPGNGIPGEPFALLGSSSNAMMTKNKKLEARYFWHVAEWFRVGTGIECVVRQGGDEFSLPPHQGAPRRNFTYWPWLSLINQSAGTRGLANYYLYALGQDQYSRRLFKMYTGGAGTTTGPDEWFDGLLVVLVKMRFRFTFTGDPLHDDMQSLLANAMTSVDKLPRVVASCKVGDLELKRCLVHFAPRFLVETLPFDELDYLGSQQGGQELLAALSAGATPEQVQQGAILKLEQFDPATPSPAAMLPRHFLVDADVSHAATGWDPDDPHKLNVVLRDLTDTTVRANYEGEIKDKFFRYFGDMLGLDLSADPAPALDAALIKQRVLDTIDSSCAVQAL